MPHRLSIVDSESPPQYDPVIEDIAMPIASTLDELESKGVSFGAETIGPFTLSRAGNIEHITFAVETFTD